MFLNIIFSTKTFILFTPSWPLYLNNPLTDVGGLTYQFNWNYFLWRLDKRFDSHPQHSYKMPIHPSRLGELKRLLVTLINFIVLEDIYDRSAFQWLVHDFFIENIYRIRVLDFDHLPTFDYLFCCNIMKNVTFFRWLRKCNVMLCMFC